MRLRTLTDERYFSNEVRTRVGRLFAEEVKLKEEILFFRQKEKATRSSSVQHKRR